MIERGDKGERERIVITEIPYAVNKSRLLENIAELVNDKKLEGIADIRDESDREGIRIVIEIKRGELPEVVLNNLYKHTALQTSFGIIMLAIVDKQPKILGLIDIMKYFIAHRQDVIRRRTRFDLKKAEDRAHILEGLIIALDHLDAVIKLIRASKNVDEARTGLMEKFKLSQLQAQAILEMQLQRLTHLERDKIMQEYQEIKALIAKLQKILGSDKLVMDIIVEELREIKERVRRRAPDGDPRRGRRRAPARGPDQGGGRRRPLHPVRLHQADLPVLLPLPDPGRQGPQGHRDEGRGRRREPLRLLDPLLPPVLHQHRAGSTG